MLITDLLSEGQALSRLSWLEQAPGPSWFHAEAGVLHSTAAAQRAL